MSVAGFFSIKSFLSRRESVHPTPKKDIDDLAQEYEDFPINETLKFRDLWAKRLTSGMSNLKEGIATHWSFGRVILVGDACHKFTSNAGLGLDSGVQDVVMPRAGKSGLTSRHSKAPTPTHQHKSVGIELRPEDRASGEDLNMLKALMP